MEKFKWDKQTVKGGFLENWDKIKNYLERTSPEFSKSVKIIEHEEKGDKFTTVVYPLQIISQDEQIF